MLEMPGWVNIMALTAEQEVLLVRQWRFGIRQMTLEIPGGLIEKGEEERVAAERELYEETGYRAKSWQYLGAVHPNPAIQSNQIGTWLATDLVQIGEPPGDGDEELEVVRLPLEQIPQAILSGEITHSLVVAAFYLFDQQRSSLSL
ncbi:MAG: NUDIX hydrolase [Acidobacteriota bacterium]